MPEILLIGENQTRMDGYALALTTFGLSVAICNSVYLARARLAGEPTALVVVDVTSPDGGWGILCEQFRNTWTTATMIALAPYRDFSHTKLEQMGLWTPEHLLVHPVSPTQLIEAVVAALGEESAAPSQSLS